jgi:hypothetical protein
MSFIVVYDLTTGPDFRISLYAQSGLQSSLKPNKFIDLFIDIDQYGLSGDAFSLSVLRPGEREDRKVLIIHKDHLHNYIVSTSLSTARSPSFLIVVEVIPPDTDKNTSRGPIIQGYGMYGRPQPPKREHPNNHEREA